MLLNWLWKGNGRRKRMKAYPYVVRDREAGNAIEYCDSLSEGEKIISRFEEEDKKDGIYTENFYECVPYEHR